MKLSEAAIFCQRCTAPIIPDYADRWLNYECPCSLGNIDSYPLSSWDKLQPKFKVNKEITLDDIRTRIASMRPHF